jgi:hypothetical protein
MGVAFCLVLASAQSSECVTGVPQPTDLIVGEHAIRHDPSAAHHNPCRTPAAHSRRFDRPEWPMPGGWTRVAILSVDGSPFFLVPKPPRCA